MKKIETVADVQNVPETEFIPMMVYGEGKCPFCGARLRSEVVGFGRDKCLQFYHCNCEVAKAAEAHNKRREELKHEAFLRRREAEEKAEEKRCAEERARKAKTPVTLTAAEVFSVVSGLIYPGLWFKETLEKVESALFYRREPLFEAKNAKEGLLAYAEEKGFRDGLEKASAVLAEYIKRPEIKWETDISYKLGEVCAEFGVPEKVTI